MTEGERQKAKGKRQKAETQFKTQNSKPKTQNSLLAITHYDQCDLSKKADRHV